MITIWHNPRCSKSRQTLALIEASERPFTVRRYLEARRGSGNSPASERRAAPAPGPLIRITAIAQGGAPLDKAKIVSVIAAASILRSALSLPWCHPAWSSRARDWPEPLP